MDSKALELAVRAANVNDIQNLMADYVQNCLKLDYKSSMDLFAIDNPEVSVEIMEGGEFRGPEHVKAYLNAIHERAQSIEEKTGWMEFQHLTTPKVVISENGQGDRAVGQWTILSPWSKVATPYPCDDRKLTAMWFIGRYQNEFVKVDGVWKILKLHLIAYVRTPFEEGWMKQADCMRVAPVRELRPDGAPRYYTFHPDAVYSYDNIYNWGPYVPKNI